MVKRTVLFLSVLAIVLALAPGSSARPPNLKSYLPFVSVHYPNRLKNASFEDGTGGDCVWWDGRVGGQRYDYCFTEIQAPAEWTAWWFNKWLVYDPYPTGRPEMAPFFSDPLRVFDGTYSLRWFTFWRTMWAGVSQQVNVPHEGRYTAKAHVQVWYSDCSEQPYATEVLDKYCNPTSAQLMVRLGIGPGGSKDPRLTTVWGDWVEAYGEWKTAEVSSVLPEGTVALFIEALSTHPLKHEDVYIDLTEFKMNP